MIQLMQRTADEALGAVAGIHNLGAIGKADQPPPATPHSLANLNLLVATLWGDFGLRDFKEFERLIDTTLVLEETMKELGRVVDSIDDLYRLARDEYANLLAISNNEKTANKLRAIKFCYVLFFHCTQGQEARDAA